MKESRQLTIARDIDRPEEPRSRAAKSPADKLYKAHCVLLDVLSRRHRGIPLADDRENMTCMAETVILIGDALATLGRLEDVDGIVRTEGRNMANAARRLCAELMGE